MNAVVRIRVALVDSEDMMGMDVEERAQGEGPWHHQAGAGGVGNSF